MTEEPNSSAHNADPRLVEKLAQLRAIEPSPPARSTFHRLVTAELTAIHHRRSTAWWRRSIRVPVPVCIVAGLGMLILLFARPPDAADTSSGIPMASPVVPATEAEPTFQITSTYMLGVGAVASETRYLSHKN